MRRNALDFRPVQTDALGLQVLLRHFLLLLDDVLEGEFDLAQFYRAAGLQRVLLLLFEYSPQFLFVFGVHAEFDEGVFESNGVEWW